MSLLMRLMFIAVVVLVASVVAGNASAANEQQQTKVKWYITGPRIFFDKKETQKISVGSGASATFAAVLPPPFDFVVAGISAVVAAQAALAAIDGNCVGVRILPPLPFMPPAVTFTYKSSDKKVGRYCK